MNTDELEVTFYWDLDHDVTKIIQTVTIDNYCSKFPPANPALFFGSNLWVVGLEELSGVIRGIQIYSDILSLSDIETEAANDSDNTPQTSAGQASVWYMNQNPTPTDISDKSGKGHDPAWVGSGRPTLYTSGESPSAPKGVRITD